MIRPLLIFGTRPEAIKMAPVVLQCQRKTEVEPIICVTGQHDEILRGVIEYFELPVDVDLSLMKPNQPLAELTARCMQAIDDVLVRFQPDYVVAQGDTTTVMAAALAAFYRRIPLVHVEAGLRTGNLRAPWPEELNRRIATLAGSLHCAPTKRAAEALLAEGVPPETVHVTGNTIIDALLMTLERERANEAHWVKKYAMLDNRPMVLLTAHRRESFGPGLDNICRAIAELAVRFSDHAFVYPVHPNPQVAEPVKRLLNAPANVHLVEPVPYPEFVWLLNRCCLILTDSGGVQEEAPSLGKPVLVMRDTTERPEAVEVGAARLVGTRTEQIVEEATLLLSHREQLALNEAAVNPYGDGHAAERIVDLMLNRAGDTARQPPPTL